MSSRLLESGNGLAARVAAIGVHDKDNVLLICFNQSRESGANGGDIVGEGASRGISDAGKCDGFRGYGECLEMLDERAKVNGTVEEAVDQEGCRGRLGIRHGGSYRNG